MTTHFKLRAYGKINLGLDVLRKREDGYHDVRMIMQTALVSNATSIILTHNHPSGNPRPSVHDDNLTKKIKSACELMDIRLLDHIIVTPYDSFFSYCDEGRL